MRKLQQGHLPKSNCLDTDSSADGRTPCITLTINGEGRDLTGHAGQLRPGIHLPSTRILTAQLGVSRSIVVEAYGQLAAEGYLLLRQGARPVVTSGLAEAAPAEKSGGPSE